MFNFSSKTYVNKEYKLSDFLNQINATKEVKLNSKKIDKVFFQNVISANSLSVEEDKTYKNIYVIRLELNCKEIPRLFIEELDKNIKFHTYYICKYEDEVCTLIAYKEIGNKVIVSTKYYGHDFEKEKPIDIPVLNSVNEAYNFILEYEIGIKIRNNEKTSEYITRVKAISKLEFQITKTEKAIAYESQPKKKFEYNERLRNYKKELAQLKMED